MPGKTGKLNGHPKNGGGDPLTFLTALTTDRSAICDQWRRRTLAEIRWRGAIRLQWRLAVAKFANALAFPPKAAMTIGQGDE